MWTEEGQSLDSPWNGEELVIRARRFTGEEIVAIRDVVQQNRDLSRRQLSLEVCRMLDWRQPNGRLKDRACRDVLLKLEELGIIQLPARRKYYPGTPQPQITHRTQPGLPITRPAGQLGKIRLEIVTGARKSREKLWNEYIERYHYLGCKYVVGPQLKYFFHCFSGLLGCIGFGGAAWKIGCRDRWIGWTAEQRRIGLPLIVNNVRYLIFPWVQSRNLASRLLGIIARRIADDWEEYHGYRPVLLETFVDPARYPGTCYKAANWIYLGLTAGRGKCATSARQNRPRKSVFVYPLCKQAIDILKHPSPALGRPLNSSNRVR